MASLSLMAKKAVVSVLSSGLVAGIIRKVYGNKIPHYSRIVHTGYPIITNQVVGYIFFKAYESAEIRFMQQYMRTDLPVVELGASLGVMAMQIADKTKQPIYSVEASPDLIPIIKNNLQKNDIRNCTVLNTIIAAGNEQFYFVRGNDNTTGHITTTALSGAIPVQSTSLSNLLTQAGVKDYILICDIEGAEVYILKEDIAALQNCRQIIIELHDTEYGGMEVSIAGMEAIIKNAGFAITDSYGPNIVFERK